MRLILELLGPPRLMGARRRFESCTGSVSIGRSPGADWIIPDSERTISRVHLRIDAAHGDFLLTDMSVNGVYVNGSQASVGYGASVKLRDGDRLQVGEAQIAVALDVGAEGSSAPTPFVLDADAFLSELVPPPEARDPLGGPFGPVAAPSRTAPAITPGQGSAPRGAVDANWMIEPVGAVPTRRSASAAIERDVEVHAPRRDPTMVERVALDRPRSLLDLIAERSDLSTREFAAAVQEAASLLEPTARADFLDRVTASIAGRR